jgi:predicted metallo-beta-lactamase superfamily hydrolase
MLKKIKVAPLAEESFGVRSMCTYIETSDVKILLDAGASLAPNRFRYPPHPQEYQAIAECRERISKAAEKADIITISHYHFDHHTPSYTDWFCNWSSAEVAKKIYEGKLVLVKSYRSMVNFSQRRRGWMFKKTGGRYAERLEIADGRTFEFGNTKLKFSDPVFHGPENSALGWVLMIAIECSDEKVLFASDVQGPMYTPTLDVILAEKPQLVIMGGPPTYLAGFRVKEGHVKQGMQNLESLVTKVPTTILEHHTLRDEKWRNLSRPIFDAASEIGHKVVTAAEFAGKENNLLEFRRRELFGMEPPSPEFKKWMKLPQQKRRLIRPPV